jgi:iron-sulfur cluster assembly protein|tara:strand:+ start:1497 stop:1823 length:327 start_codon:yes stop_codon:yes gene_type:complete
MITIAESAYEPLLNRLATKPDCEGIRVAVRTVGCSGLAYVLEYSYSMDSNDVVIHDRGVTLVVDYKSKLYLEGTRMEYQKEGLNEGFIFVNPNVTSECGCGESFYVEK